MAEAALHSFSRAWRALEELLPSSLRVRMEGVNPDALPPRTAAWLALGYPVKWATTSFQCPREVREHFELHAAALRALSQLPLPPPDAPRVRLGLVGDCMWMRDSWEGWASPATQRLLDSLTALVGNLETPLHSSPPRSLAWRLQALLPDMVTYSSPAAFLRAFRRGGALGGTPAGGPWPDAPPLVGAFSTTNNHSADCGAEGARSTLEALEEEGMPSSGLRADGEPQTWCMFERAAHGEAGCAAPSAPAEAGSRRSPRRGPPPAPSAVLRVGFYATSSGVNFPAKAAACAADGVVLQITPGLASAPHDCAGVDLREAKVALRAMLAAGCGLRIVCVHWGHEFEGYSTAGQMGVARQLVAAGADILLGCHAHLAQPAEVLLVNGYRGETAAEASALARLPASSRLTAAGPPRKALVLYGMGNFCNSMFNELCRVGLLATLQLRPPPAASPAGTPWAWSAPAWHWLYNEAAVLRGHGLWSRRPRRLLHVRSVGRDTAALAEDAVPEAGQLCRRKREQVEFMVGHVLGDEEGGAAKRERCEEARPPRFLL